MAVTMSVLFENSDANWSSLSDAQTAVNHADTGVYAGESAKSLLEADVSAGKCSKTPTLVNSTSMRVVYVYDSADDFQAMLVEKNKIYSGTKGARSGWTVSTSVT